MRLRSGQAALLLLDDVIAAADTVEEELGIAFGRMLANVARWHAHLS